MENEQQGSEAKVGVSPSSDGKGVSPASNVTGPNGTSGSQPVSPAPDGKSPEQSQPKPESIPFGDKRHPEYKRFRELTENNRRYKEQLEKVSNELAELRGFRDSMMTQRNQSGPQVTDDQRQALLSLFQMGLSVPEVKEMIAKSYGLDRLDKLDKDYSGFKDNWESQQYQSEMKDVIEYAKTSGLDPEDVEEELRDHVANHPAFSQIGYSKGAVWAAFRDKYWDRLGELRERADNLKKIEERDRLKNGETQEAAATAKSGEIPLPERDGIGRNVEVIRRMGGVSKLPFFR